jgi:hypothetical protein
VSSASWPQSALYGALAGLVLGALLFGAPLLLPRAQPIQPSARSSDQFTPAPAPAPSETSVPPLTPVTTASVSARSARSASGPHENWRELARDGHFARAYSAAAESFEAECERASVLDLLLLADAARLSAHRQQASQAYAAVRRRFAGSDAASRAAFTLGRLAFDSGSYAAALGWFETYLAEQPGGALAPAALDRSFEAAQRSGDAERTRGVAKRYLARRPKGAHADEARRILAEESM